MPHLRERIKSLCSNRDVRVLAENFVSLSILKAIGYVLPLITLPYLARVIGVKSFGAIAFAASIIAYVQVITEFGFNYTAIRDVAKNRNDLAYVSSVFSNVMVAKIILMLFSMVILVVLMYSVPILYQKRLLLWMTFLYVPGYIMFPEWFFQAMEKMKYVTVMNLIAQSIFTVLVFVVIKRQEDYVYQPLLVASGYWVSGILALVFIFRKFRIRFILPTLDSLWSTLKGSWNMFISLFLPNLYTNFSVILMNSYAGNVATGIYSSGYRFINIFDQLTAVLSRTFYPFLARRLGKHGIYVKISGILSIIMMIALFLGADLLVKIFYTPEFAPAAKVVRIMSVTPFFIFLMNTYGPNYLVLCGKEKVLKNIILVCSVGGFILSWILVTHYSYIGMAVVLTVVWGIRGFLTWFFAVRIKKQIESTDVA